MNLVSEIDFRTPSLKTNLVPKESNREDADDRQNTINSSRGNNKKRK